MMFFIGLFFGIFIGSLFWFIILALLTIAKKADEGKK